MILELVGHAERLIPLGNTDVWTHDGVAYLGTSERHCGTGEVDDSGIQIYSVDDPKNPQRIGALPSVKGSRSNDVKVAAMVGGVRLVHSNESCEPGGPGGFEVYDVSDPHLPIHLAHVETNSVNKFSRTNVGETNVGVHNLYLFHREGSDYVASQVNTTIGSFQIFDISNPSNVNRIGYFGAEALRWPYVNWETTSDLEFINEVESYLAGGFGQMRGRNLHDLYVTPDGKLAYLAHWDAGLILLDLAALSQPQVLSVALELDSGHGEVNSHSVWPTDDGRIVVEGAEDFNSHGTEVTIMNTEEAQSYPAVEGTFTRRIKTLPEESLSGPTVYLGLGCDSMSKPTSKGQVALILRGECSFSSKLDQALNLGYTAAVVFNHQTGGAETITMGARNQVNLPAVFVNHGAGLALGGVKHINQLTPGTTGATIRVKTAPNGWGGVRIWDYTDPRVPILASTFNTECSANPDTNTCARGILSSHNVIVEDNLAYISWYAEGLVVLDISNPYKPVEISRYRTSGPSFRLSNGGDQDIWGVHKVPGEPWIYISDRNGGMYVLEIVIVASEQPKP